jgi:hypothetical protein
MATSRAAAAVKVYVDGVLDTTLRPLIIEESIGGTSLDYAVLESDASKGFKSITGVNLIESQKEIIEISIDQTVGGVEDHFVHFGQYSQIEPILDENREGIRYISRTERFHFGEPLKTIRVYSPNSGTVRDVDWDMIFNPIVDGKVVGSRNRTVKDGQHGGVYVFVHPDAVVSSAGQTLHGGTSEFWNLTEAVLYACRVLNPINEFISNPFRGEVSKIFSDDDILQDVRIKRGQYLPDILARLVEPFGYSWYLKRELGKRSFRFFRKGITEPIFPLKLQAAGEEVDVTKSNVKRLNATFDKSQLANQVTVIGGPIQAEFTAVLNRSWPTSLDIYDREQLTKKLIHENPDRVDVYRKYVLNEGGDYTGIRPGLKLFTWSSVFTTLEIPVRKRALPTLTLQPFTLRAYGAVSGVHVEMTDGISATETWIAVPAGSCQILQDEIGVYFNGEMPLEELHHQGLAGKVRITCTVESDQRIKHTAIRHGTSPQPNVAELVLSAPDSFQYRFRAANASLNGTSHPTLERDDRAALEQYADRLRETFDAAKGKGKIVIEGVDQGLYTLGDRISKIEGIEMDLQMNTAGARIAIYPFIAALRFDIQRQETTVTIDQLRRLPQNANLKIRDKAS